MAAEIEIDGRQYPLPNLFDLDMDELQVLYDYSGITPDQFVPEPDETEEDAKERQKIFANPAFIRALMHIAYQRAFPKMAYAKVKAACGSANFISVYQSLAASTEEGEADPPASTSAPDRQSPSDALTSSESSGDGSTNASDEPASVPETTGTTRSDTSSPPSAPIALVH